MGSLLLICLGVILPFQDSDPEKVFRFRDVILIEAPVKGVQTDQGKGVVLESGKDLSLVKIPSESSKVEVTGESGRADQYEFDSLDEIDFSEGISVTVQVYDDAVEVEREEEDKPVVVVVYVEEEGKEHRFSSALLIRKTGKVRVPLPLHGVAYLFSPSGGGGVYRSTSSSPAARSSAASDQGFQSGITLSVGGVFGFDMEAGSIPSLITVREEDFFGGIEKATQTLQLKEESYSLAKLQIGFNLLDWLQVGLSGVTGSFDAEGTLHTHFSVNTENGQSTPLDVEGAITGLGLELWFTDEIWDRGPLHVQTGGTFSCQWVEQEFERFDTPPGYDKTFDFTSDLEGKTETLLSFAVGGRTSGTWALSSKVDLGFHLQAQWFFGDLEGFSLESGIWFQFRF